MTPLDALMDEPTACPLADGIDVGLLVRRSDMPRPTEHEQGVTCILRSGVPLVEQGPSALDPYDGFVVRRADGNAVAACEQAAADRDAPLRESIQVRVGRLIAMVGHDAASVDIFFHRRAGALRIELIGPSVTPAVRQALAVRVLDALRADGRTHGHVDVDYRARQPLATA